MKWYFLFSIVLLLSTIIAQTLEDKNEPVGDKTTLPESTQLTDSFSKSQTLIDSLPKGWELGYKQGQIDGNKNFPIEWFMGGFAGGAFGCCIGGRFVTSAAKAVEVKPYFIPKGDSAYKTGYLKGYIDSSKSKRELFALRGSVLGMACFAVVIVSFFYYISAVGSTM